MELEENRVLINMMKNISENSKSNDSCIYFSKCPERIFVLKVGQNMNGKQYLKVLKKNVLPDMKSHKCKIMFADRAPSHTAKKSISYLKKEKVKTMYIFPWQFT